jgi:formylglycine-generating enzyme required for sulfatase activity
MTWVAPGAFQMGSAPTEAGHEPDERLHSVALGYGFWLGRTEVTVRQWRFFVDESGFGGTGAGSGIHVRTASGWKLVADAGWRSPGFPQDDTHPVVGASWEDAVEFCRWLTARERAAGRLPKGWSFALPTEAQWEYACRADTTTAFSWGEPIDPARANFKPGQAGAAYGEGTSPVASYPANAWGFFDMHGNVWEWCADAYGEYPSGDAVDPAPVAEGEFRVKRGGSWVGAGENCRSANRNRDLPDHRAFHIGFRICLRRE